MTAVAIGRITEHVLRAVLDVAEVVGDARAGDPAGSTEDANAADLAAHRLLVSTVSGLGVWAISEEDDDVTRSPAASGLRAYIDPIDGSRNWYQCAGPHGPSVCLLDQEGPLWSVVYDLWTGQVTTAERGGGIDVGQSGGRDHYEAPSSPVVLGGPSWSPPEPGLRHVVNGATAHDLCALAVNDHDIYLDTVNTVRPWDYLGGLLVLREAGGYCADLDGRPIVPVADERYTRRLHALSPAATARVRELDPERRDQ